jgi:hypothetical protein
MIAIGGTWRFVHAVRLSHVDATAKSSWIFFKTFVREPSISGPQTCGVGGVGVAAAGVVGVVVAAGDGVVADGVELGGGTHVATLGSQTTGSRCNGRSLTAAAGLSVRRRDATARLPAAR